jgi:hypothetical protein
VLDPDQPRRVRRALAHAEDAAVAALGKRLLVQDGDRQPAVRSDLLGPGRELGRHQIGGTGVDQVAHQAHGVREHLRPVRRWRRVAGMRQHGQAGAGGRLGAVAPERIPAEQAAQGHGADLRRVAGGQGQCDPHVLRAPGAAAGDQGADRGPGGPAQRLRIESRIVAPGGTHAHGGDQRRGKPAARRDSGDFPRLAGGAKRGQRLRQGSA